MPTLGKTLTEQGTCSEIQRLANLPRLLVVTDYLPAADSTGAARTLFHLFRNYPRERILFLLPVGGITNGVPEQNRLPVLYGGEKFKWKIPQGRLRGLTTILSLAVNCWLTERSKSPFPADVVNFKPEVILSCPVDWWACAMGNRLKAAFHIPLIPYFMDNFLGPLVSHPLARTALQSVRRHLQDNPDWIGISMDLATDLSNELSIPYRRLNVSCNPIDLATLPPPAFDDRPSDHYEIVYSGSIWPFHEDSVKILVGAIRDLQSQGIRINLRVATLEQHWRANQPLFDACGAEYLGWLSPINCFQLCTKAHLLLVAASFDAHYKRFSSGSYQTKMTDYMATGRAIFCNGPSYSICGRFVQNNDCGFFCASSDPHKVAAALMAALEDPAGRERVARSAYDIVSTKYNIDSMQRDLYRFIADTVYPPASTASTRA